MAGAAFQRKWSKELHAACVEAIMVYGFSARQAAEAAARGELPGKGRDVPPAAPPAGTVGDWAKDARRLAKQQERATESPAERLRSGLGELVAMWERDVDRARKQKGKVPMARVAELAKTGRELDAMARGLHKTRPTQSADGPADGDAEDKTGDGASEDFLGSLAQSEGTKRNGASGRSLGARST